MDSSGSTSRLPDALKAFAFSAQLAHADLARIESEYQVALGHAGPDAAEPGDAYYPQFDEDLRREAAEMGRHYEGFYCLEKSIRRLIDQTIEANIGRPWWDSGPVPQSIHEDEAKR